MDFEKLFVIYLIIFAVVLGLLLMAIGENRELRKENRQMKKILYWRDDR